MPLHGKIVVIKRSGGDGTEFPLTATCLFGRKADCDIRIQLPQVSKEHCRIDLNENKEVILTNLSSVNPTCVNGEVLQQSERLKHGDVITVIDRSFRFEYPPTPKKRSSIGGKSETFKVLQDQQVGDTVTTETKEKRIPEVSTDPHLKDGTNHDNIQRSLDGCGGGVEVESKEDDSLLQNKTTSPFNDLYQMIKQSLDVKTPRKSSASRFQTPTSKFYTPKPGSVKKSGGSPIISTEDKTIPKKDEAKATSGAVETKVEVESNVMPVSFKKQRKSFQVPATEMARIEAGNAVKTEANSPKRAKRATPQRFTVVQVIEQLSAQTPKSPLRRRSKETTPGKPAEIKEQEKQAVTSSVKKSPDNSGKVEKVKQMSKKRKSGELAADLPTQQMKRKRVSFGGHLSPELFDKRLPPDSPLRKGATPRRSLCLPKPKQSLLRRASVIGLLQEHTDSPNVRSPTKMRTPSPKKFSSAKNACPKTPSPAKKSPKSRPSSPKAASPAKNSPKSRTPSPKAVTPGKKPPKSRTPSPKAVTPGKKSPKSETPSPKAVTPAKKSPKSKTPSPKAVTPGKKSPKSKTPSPKAATPAKKSPKSKTPSPKAVTPGKKSPKSKTPSPKAVTPGKKSPKSETPSPKAVTPGKKSPKSRTTSPKAVTPREKSPKSRTPSPKAVTLGKKSPKSRTPSPKATSPATKPSEFKSHSPARGRSLSNNKAETPKDNEQVTPGVRGRFSVSRICTPSPINEHAVTDQVPLVTVTPKIPLRRKSMKSTSRKTQSTTNSALKVMCRRSGISRGSMKALSSWANIVKFGQTKVQVDAPAKKMVAKKMRKKAVPKPRTPAGKLKGHASTGHADSPVTIIVGRAHQQKVVHSTGAAPRLVTNAAVLKKNMEMDEDLTGISEMFKTPVNERKRRSVIGNSALKTPLGGLSTPVVDPSVLSTPEEPGEMMVSPLSVSSTVKDKKYNCEAVQRLLDGDQESSFLSDVPPAIEADSDSSEQQGTDMKTTSAPTPKQKPEMPDCLTGVKRIMKTPRKKAEPVEDLRGKLLKTPKQKPEQHECLTGMKRIMKTPRQKAEPVEDLRGRLLKTPKQKPEQQECLTGVKRIFETPQQEAEPLQDLRGKLLETPKALEAGDVSRDGVEEITETSTCVQQSDGPSEMTDVRRADVKSSPLVCLTGEEINDPVEDMVVVKRLMKTPREKIEPVEDNFGLKRLLKSPRMRDNAPVEDFEGLKELMEESLADPTGQLETNEVDDQTPLTCVGVVAKETDFVLEEPQDDVSTDVIDVPSADGGKGADANEVFVDDHLEEEPRGHDNDELSDSMETFCQAAVNDNLPVEEAKPEAADVNLSEDPKLNTVDETVSEEQPKMETATGKVTETDTTAGDPDLGKTSSRSRRGKTVESKSPENKQEAEVHSGDPVVPAPVRGRGGRKNEVSAPPAIRQTSRRKNPKTTESGNVEQSVSLVSNVAHKPTRGRNAKKSTVDKVEAEMVPESENDQRTPCDVNHKANDSATPLEKAVLKPKRGRKPKQPEKSVPEQQDEPFTQSYDAPQADTTKDVDENKVSRGSDENESNAMKTAPRVPATESLPEVETATCKVTEIEAATVQKKSVRSRKVKMVQSKSAEDKEEVIEHSEDPIVPAPVRGRRGKKTEVTALPAVRQTRGSRNVKAEESSSNYQPEMVPEKNAETTRMTEIITEAVTDQTSPVITHEGENGSAPSAEETVMKPTRGRKTKKPVEPIQPEKNEVVTDDHPMTNDQPQKSIPSLGKPRRGRKMKPDVVEQSEAAEDAVLTVETMQQPRPPVRAKRGRNAKVVEEKLENDNTTASAEILKSQEPVKKLRRTRMAEKDHVELKEIPTAEMVVPVEAEVPLVAEPVKMTETDVMAPRTTRGGREAKKGTERESHVKATEVQEAPAASSMDKPKRGRRGKQVTKEVAAVVPEEKTNHKLETEKKKDEEADPPVIKSSTARGVKTEVSLVIPAKRARRGAAPLHEETTAESTVSQSVSSSVVSGKRGRRAAAKPVKDDPMTSDQANHTEDLGKVVKEDTQESKRSVKWKNDIEVFEILNVTPAKATRGRKSKLGDQVDAKSQTVSKRASKTEEKDLSDTAAEALPAKRARRGSKIVDVASDKGEVKSVEAETQPKPRRGRSAKK